MSHCCGGSEQTITLNVEGMSCGHCKASVEKAVSAINGLTKVAVDLADKKVIITFDPAKVSKESFVNAIIEQGYHVS